MDGELVAAAKSAGLSSKQVRWRATRHFHEFLSARFESRLKVEKILKRSVVFTHDAASLLFRQALGVQ